MKIRILKIALMAAAILTAALFLRIGSASKPKNAGTPQNPVRAKSLPPENHPRKIDEPDKDGHEAKMLNQALLKNPGHSPVLLRLANLASTQGHPQEAAKYLREILQQEPQNMEARLELGKALFESGDTKGAIVETESILKTQPLHPEALYNLGAIYGNLGNNDRARGYWEQLIKSAPESENGRRAKQMIAQLNKDHP